MFLLSIVVFFIYLVKFFIRVKTVTFFIAPNSTKIEFWKNKKDAQKIDQLIELIEQRQATVEIPLEYPSGNSIYASKYSPVLKFLASLFMFSVPALMTEDVRLFLLVLLPVVWFAYKGIQYMKLPAEYRKAISFYIQKRWDDAINLLDILRQQSPQYLPAYTLLVGIYLRIKRFDDALSTAASLPDDYCELAQKLQTDIWYFKRLYERRKNIPT